MTCGQAPGGRASLPRADQRRRSADATLIYEWKVAKDGARLFQAKLWDGHNYRTILNQHVAAPPK